MTTIYHKTPLGKQGIKRRFALIFAIFTIILSAGLGPLVEVANASDLPTNHVIAQEQLRSSPKYECVRENIAILRDHYGHASWVSNVEHILLGSGLISIATKQEAIARAAAVGILAFGWGYYGAAYGYYSTAIIVDCWSR